MTYIQGYVMSVPTKNRDAYRDYCVNFQRHFAAVGGLRLVECWGDDIPEGKITDFKRAAQLKADETALLSWMEFPDKKTRDGVFHQMRTNPEIVKAIQSDLYDRSRMFNGGFEVISDKGARGKMGYAEGSLMPVPLSMKEKYRAWADASNELFLKHGATRAVTAWPDDVPAAFGPMVAAQGDEVTTYCWIEWPSAEARQQGWQKIMADPAMRDLGMPVDGKRMFHGGFVPLLDA